MDWIIENKGKVELIIVLLFVVPLLAVHILFKISGPYWLQAKWSAGDALGFIGAFYAFCGTILLSFLALYQNHIIAEKDDKYRNLMQEIEIQKRQPIFTLAGVSYNGKYSNLKVSMTNSSNNQALNFLTSNFKLFSLNGTRDLSKNGHSRNVVMGEQTIELPLNNVPFKLNDNEYCGFTFTYEDILGNTYKNCSKVLNYQMLPITLTLR